MGMPEGTAACGEPMLGQGKTERRTEQQQRGTRYVLTTRLFPVMLPEGR